MSRTIEWRLDGSRLVVPVIVYPPLTGTTFDGVAGNALIDTGSTTTGVTIKIAQQLGIRSIGKRLISTATSSGSVSMVAPPMTCRPFLRQCAPLIASGNRCRLTFGV